MTKGDVLLVFDPRGVGAASYAERLGDYLRALRASPPAPGSDGVAVPGDRSRAERRRRLEAGIPLPASLWCDLIQLRDDVIREASARA